MSVKKRKKLSTKTLIKARQRLLVAELDALKELLAIQLLEDSSGPNPNVVKPIIKAVKAI